MHMPGRLFQSADQPLFSQPAAVVMRVSFNLRQLAYKHAVCVITVFIVLVQHVIRIQADQPVLRIIAALFMYMHLQLAIQHLIPVDHRLPLSDQYIKGPDRNHNGKAQYD